MSNAVRWWCICLASLAANLAASAPLPDASVFVEVVDGGKVLANVHASGRFEQPLVAVEPGVVRVTMRIERPDDRGWSSMALKLEVPAARGWQTLGESVVYLPLDRASAAFCNGNNFTVHKPGTPLYCIQPRLGAGAPHYSAAQWPSVAQRKLDAVHQLLVDVHPGGALDDDPDFARWLHDGYHEASTLAKQASSESLAGGVLRYYIAGFRDEHLQVVQPQPPVLGWAGWRAAFRGDALVVVHRSDAWAAPLPPLDAVVESCDGQDAAAYVLTTLASFNDRRTDAATVRALLAARFSVDPGRIPGRDAFRACTFRLPDGARRTLPMHWQYYAPDVFPDAEAFGDRSARGTFGIDDLGDGTIWVRLPTFQPRPDERAVVDEIAARLETLAHARWVVFDLRGNDGGNSAIGSRLLDALTGGLDVTDAQAATAPPMYALWRVSPQSASAMKDGLLEALRHGGVANPSTDFRLEYSRRMDAALAAGAPWVRQEGGPALTPALVDSWGARPRHFSGRIALVTDDACFSACLDFMDESMLVPGTLHLGRTTSADTRYMDVGIYRVDDDVQLQMPQKAWFGRARGNNAPYVPARIQPATVSGDAALRAWVLGQLDP